VEVAEVAGLADIIGGNRVSNKLNAAEKPSSSGFAFVSAESSLDQMGTTPRDLLTVYRIAEATSEALNCFN
jgi:hypothetical protein